MLTPNDIDVLIHFCVCPAPHERQGAPAVRESIAMFVAAGILEPSESRSGYQGTERGLAHLKQLCSIPYPTMSWVDVTGMVIKDN